MFPEDARRGRTCSDYVEVRGTSIEHQKTLYHGKDDGKSDRDRLLAKKKRISYFCKCVARMERSLIYSKEYLEFEQGSSARVREKLRYATAILETVYPIPAKFVKKLTHTDFYELRVSVEQEVRVILFAVDDTNINLSKRVIFLNGFIKKANKDYVREVGKAMEILRRLL